MPEQFAIRRKRVERSPDNASAHSGIVDRLESQRMEEVAVIFCNRLSRLHPIQFVFKFRSHRSICGEGSIRTIPRNPRQVSSTHKCERRTSESRQPEAPVMVIRRQ